MLKLLMAPLLIAVGLAAVPTSAADAAPSSSTGSSVSASAMLARLAVTAESHSARYKVSSFTHWVDADGDGENTRTEVLKAESLVSVLDADDGSPSDGYWESPYDGRSVFDASATRIDHLVPLKEAWSSGAWKWSAEKREAYANDLGYAPSLIVVSAQAEHAKGNKEPQSYLPSEVSYRCTYVKNWIGVKWRWHLTVDRAEKKALSAALSKYCASTRMKRPAKPLVSHLVEHARPIAVTADPGANVPEPIGPAPVALDPTPIVTPGAYYANCDAVRAAGAAPLYSFETGYRPGLDSDGDGVACEVTTSTSPTWTPSPVVSSPVVSSPIVSSPTASGAICRDGTTSSSTHRSGTCSHHGGVASWL
jgi:hypothetical protein